ncbi:unnamed protein product [Meloidogyne enterolobii]|uniref:Uncharacterized protein n=1 Tax=Meloidogyne enterolobii TaxID=390850 RepID=A0ACB0ZT04_MELEN
MFLALTTFNLMLINLNMLGKNFRKIFLERKREIAGQYAKSFQIFSTVHNDLNTWYARIDKSGETVQNLYSKIKGIFLNGHQLFDFPLGRNKPENVFYVGGIHLKEFKHEQARFLKTMLGSFMFIMKIF